MKLPEIYEGCAHPQSVWFEEHWRPLFEQLQKENEELKRQHEMAMQRADRAFNERDSLREQLAEACAARDQWRKVQLENASLRESLKEAVEALTIISGKHETLCVDDLEDARFDAEETLAKLKAKHGEK
jgi:ABC-type glutathione transport system ATPase component